MSLSTNFPAIAPSLNLDFANTRALDPRITFTRASTATYYDGQTVAMAEQNLLTYSQAFNNWSKYGTTAAGNTTTAPDGTSTAGTITASAGNVSHYITLNAGFGTSGTFAYSVYAKAGTHNFVMLSLNNGTSNYATVTFDVSTGAVTQTTVSNYTVSSSQITDVGNGWYRISMVCDASISANVGQTIQITSNGTPTIGNYGLETWNAAGTETVYLWGAQLEQRSSVTAYTATTTQPITNYIPVLRTAAAGVPRFDCNPTTSESLGLLIEEQRTNLFTYSGAMASSFNTSSASLTNSKAVCPDGTISASSLIPDTSNGGHGIYNSNTFGSGTFTFSVYAKAAGYPRLGMRVYDGSAYRIYATFDISAGTIVNAAVGTATVTAVGDGWYRCVCTGTSASGNMGQLAGWTIESLPSNKTVQEAFIGDGFSGCLVWGAQLEAGTFPTSYIATTSAQVTRSADAASMTGTNFSSWYRADEGTFYTEAAAGPALPSTLPGYLFDASDSTTHYNRITNQMYSSQLYTSVLLNNALEANYGTGTISASGFKTAMAYKVNDIATSLNNGTAATDSSATIPNTIGILYFGRYVESGTNYYMLNRCIKKLAYYPLRLTNTQLKALTS